MKNYALFFVLSSLVSMHGQNAFSQSDDRTDWYENSVANIFFGPWPRTFEGAEDPGYKDQIRYLLERTGATMVGFHACSQPGWANYATTAGIPNPNLKGVDIIRIWRDVTKEMGVKLFVYWSLLKSDAEGAAHPEFYQINAKGDPIGSPRILLCHNSPYYDTYVFPKIKELIEEYDVDGHWFDHTVNTVNYCYCPYCTEGFRKLYGQDPPKDRTDPLWPKFAEFRRESFEESMQRIGDYIHKLDPSCIFVANYAYSIYQPEQVPDHIDIISADIGQERRTQVVSVKARFADTQEVPWEIMVGCGFSNSGLKSADYLNQEAAVVRANGGQLFLWTGTLPNASLSPYSTELEGQVSDFVRDRLDVFQHTEPVRDVGILISASAFYKNGDGLNHWMGVSSVRNPVEGAHIAMIKNNYHVNLFADYDLDRRLKDYRVVIISQQTVLSSEAVHAIRDYVRGGGKIVVAGKVAMDPGSPDTPRSMLEDVLGVRFLDEKPMEMAYIPWKGLALRVQCEWYPVATTTAGKIHPIWKDWNELKPVELSYPAMTVNRFGEGIAVYIAGDLFTGYYNNQHFGIRELIEKAMVHADNNKIIETDAPVAVEFSIRRKDGNMIVHMVNRLVDWDMDDPGAVQVGNIPPVGPFYLGVKCADEPRDVVLEPADEHLDWNWRNGYTWVTIPGVHIHEALVIKGTN